MEESCTHNCETCKSNCSSRKIEKLKLKGSSSIKKIIGISSGKGGVGKSFVTSMIATNLQKQGYKVGILDGDILGASIPKSFNLKIDGINATDDNLMIPIESKTCIKIISANLLLDKEEDPIIYRGALISSVLQQFYNEVFWGDLDYLLIDMPPGTGDIPLTVYQMIPIDYVIIVSSPQSLVSMVVEKSINMAKMMNINILGIIENMSYVECSKCKEKLYVFGKSNIEEIAKKNDIEVLAKIPMRSEYSYYVDNGKVEELNIVEFENINKKIAGLLK